jgi:hypothetical protein
MFDLSLLEKFDKERYLVEQMVFAMSEKQKYD